MTTPTASSDYRFLDDPLLVPNSAIRGIEQSWPKKPEQADKQLEVEQATNIFQQVSAKLVRLTIDYFSK